MKTLLPYVVGASALALALCATACQSTSKHAMSEAEMMTKWTEYATPSESHKALESKAGRWSLKVKMFMAPGAPASESPATSESKWVMDGRYLEDNTTGSFQGQPFLGHGVTGYDNLTKKYNAVWFDNMGTGIMKSEGTYDAKTKTFTYASQQPDFAAGEYVKARVVETLVDNDHWTMQVYGPDPDGNEFLCMEIEYTRAR